jgi:hypothetical protein
MAWGDKEAVLNENAGMKREIELLREMLEDKKKDIEELQAALRRTQDALVAKESPEAYRDHRAAEAAADQEPTPEQQKRMDEMREEAIRTQRLIDGMEDPLFKDAEDLVDKLSPLLMGNPELGSLHNDGES